MLSGLAWFEDKAEADLLRQEGFACVYAIGPESGRPLRVAYSADLRRETAELQIMHWLDLRIHAIVWTPGDRVARRIKREAHRLLDKAGKRLRGDWFDLVPHLARGAMDVAARNLDLPVFSHEEMMRRVREIRQRRIEAALRAAVGPEFDGDFGLG